MTPNTQKRLTELMSQRETLFSLLQTKKSQGEFDAHAKGIILIIEGLLAVINYLVVAEEERKRK